MDLITASIALTAAGPPTVTNAHVPIANTPQPATHTPLHVQKLSFFLFSRFSAFSAAFSAFRREISSDTACFSARRFSALSALLLAGAVILDHAPCKLSISASVKVPLKIDFPDSLFPSGPLMVRILHYRI